MARCVGVLEDATSAPICGTTHRTSYLAHPPSPHPVTLPKHSTSLPDYDRRFAPFDTLCSSPTHSLWVSVELSSLRPSCSPQLQRRGLQLSTVTSGWLLTYIRLVHREKHVSTFGFSVLEGRITRCASHAYDQCWLRCAPLDGSTRFRFANIQSTGVATITSGMDLYRVSFIRRYHAHLDCQKDSASSLWRRRRVCALSKISATVSRRHPLRVHHDILAKSKLAQLPYSALVTRRI